MRTSHHKLVSQGCAPHARSHAHKNSHAAADHLSVGSMQNASDVDLDEEAQRAARFEEERARLAANDREQAAFREVLEETRAPVEGHAADRDNVVRRAKELKHRASVDGHDWLTTGLGVASRATTASGLMPPPQVATLQERLAARVDVAPDASAQVLQSRFRALGIECALPGEERVCADGGDGMPTICALRGGAAARWRAVAKM